MEIEEKDEGKDGDQSKEGQESSGNEYIVLESLYSSSGTAKCNIEETEVLSKKGDSCLFGSGQGRMQKDEEKLNDLNDMFRTRLFIDWDRRRSLHHEHRSMGALRTEEDGKIREIGRGWERSLMDPISTSKSCKQLDGGECRRNEVSGIGKVKRAGRYKWTFILHRRQLEEQLLEELFENNEEIFVHEVGNDDEHLREGRSAAINEEEFLDGRDEDGEEDDVKELSFVGEVERIRNGQNVAVDGEVQGVKNGYDGTKRKVKHRSKGIMSKSNVRMKRIVVKRK